MTYAYTYDDNGNILSVSDGTNTTSYVYDSANQLIRENNQAANKTYTWTYDNAGNILQRKEYAYTTGSLGSPRNAENYIYGDSAWGDLLTEYGGITITYDAIGNPTRDHDYNTYTWEHGRQLATYKEDGNESEDIFHFVYNADGLRIKAYNAYTTYSYIYNGSKLVQMEISNTSTGAVSDTLSFTYDAQGSPQTVTYNGTLYFYATNLQGDVAAILDSTGTAVVEYTYNAWGYRTSDNDGTGTLASTLGKHNPLRYRGYIYDMESGLYYLQSRYYDPEMGRFINADAYASTGQGILGHNMFAYCLNNPVCRTDPSGAFSFLKWLESWLDTLWAAAADALDMAGYELTATLLRYAASGKNDSYYARPGSNASRLIASDEGFINEVHKNHMEKGKGQVPYTSSTDSYEFPVTNRDLGAALHWVEYKYYVAFSHSTQKYIYFVRVTDKFDFTEFKNPFTQESVAAGFLWLVNDFAAINQYIGVLDEVTVTIDVAFAVDP